MRQIRVLYLLNSPGGGATLGIVELLKGLPRERYWSCVVAPHAPTEAQADAFARLADEFHIVPTATWHLASNLPKLRQVAVMVRTLFRTRFHLTPVGALRRLIRSRNVDIVYTCTAMEIDGAIAARWERVPHIWHVKEWLGGDGRVSFPLPDSLAARLFGALSARVVVMSDFIAGFFRRHGATAKLQVLADGVDVEAYRGELNGHEVRQRLGVARDEILVGMTAALSATWKQHQLFVDAAVLAAQRCPRLRFVAFGNPPVKTGRTLYDGPWHYHENLRARVGELGLSDRFIWGGFCSNIPQMMGSLDILVHPCSHEPFGRVAIEAMAAGVPVVGPATGGIAETIVDGETGLLVPAEPEAFSRAIHRLAQDPVLRRDLGAGGRRRAEAVYSLARHAGAVGQLLDALVAQAEETRR